MRHRNLTRISLSFPLIMSVYSTFCFCHYAQFDSSDRNSSGKRSKISTQNNGGSVHLLECFENSKQCVTNTIKQTLCQRRTIGQYKIKQYYAEHYPFSECLRPLDDVLGHVYNLLPRCHVY